MISDSERREVARRLRDNANQDWEWVVPWAIFNDAKEHDAPEIQQRLADLIEPSGHECVPGECPINVRHDNDRIDRDALLALADICESTGNMYDSCRSEAVDGALVGLLRETTEFELKDGPYRLKDGPYRQRGAGGEPMDENHFANLIIALAAVYVIGFVVIVLAIYATA